MRLLHRILLFSLPDKCESNGESVIICRVSGMKSGRLSL